jgi:hypothetical protein
MRSGVSFAFIRSHDFSLFESQLIDDDLVILVCIWVSSFSAETFFPFPPACISSVDGSATESPFALLKSKATIGYALKTQLELSVPCKYCRHPITRNCMLSVTRNVCLSVVKAFTQMRDTMTVCTQQYLRPPSIGPK